MSSPIYDQLIREREGNIPGTFTPDELALLINHRRLLGLAERPALMPPAPPVVNKHRRVTPIVPLWTLREKGRGSEDTQEMDSQDLVSSLK
jgi:hypothetical protein